MLELGTVTHRVEPVNAEALHWKEDGEDRFSKGHVVSGIKAHLFYTRTMDDVEDFIKRSGRQHDFARIKLNKES